MSSETESQDVVEKELVFLPLGGAGEIGMNLNLYGYGEPDEEDWIIVDLGITFGDDTTPGIDVMMADPEFIEERAENLHGIIFTHAHEDHIGAIGYLWRRLRCPVYATPFTATILRNKLQEAGLTNDVEVHEIPLGGRFKVGPFEVEMITFTHSILEPNLLAIRSPLGTVIHTGDWKLDPGPVIGETADVQRVRQIGEEGVLAIVCDSTNVFSEGHTGSEDDLIKDLSEVISECSGQVAVACFASNVARLHTIAKAAEANNRKVVLAGRSLYRMTEAARDNGYLLDIPNFLEEKEVRNLRAEETLIICTGSQGEPRAALARIAAGNHAHIKLGSGDTVIFSSKNIPGNERAISRLQNDLARRGIAIITNKERHIHVSGHPSRDELRAMFELVKPQIAVPVHGEFRHLQAHAELARQCGVKETFVIENGNMVKLAPAPACVVDEVETGRLAVEGNRIVPLESEVVRTRNRALWNGSAVASIVVDRDGRPLSDPVVSTDGLLDPDGDKKHWEALISAIYRMIDDAPSKDRRDAEMMSENIRIGLRRWFKAILGKRAVTKVHYIVV